MEHLFSTFILSGENPNFGLVVVEGMLQQNMFYYCNSLAFRDRSETDGIFAQ